MMHSMRAWSLFAAGLAVVGFLAGCSGGTEAAKGSETAKTSEGAANAEGKLKVALLTPGPVSDAGWSAMAYDGLLAIRDELGAEINNEEARDSQIRDSMRSYAQQGYNLVIGHGFEYNEPAVEIAKDFPNTVFVSTSGAGTATNAGAYRFHLEEGFYLAGYMAGLLTTRGAVAMIGGPDVPSIRSTFKAFRAGAEAARPGIKVIETFTGKNEDVAAARQATLAAIDQGADFVIHQANAGAQGVFNAAKERGVYAFGANADQNANESGVVIASAVIVAKPAFLSLAKQVQEGTYKGAVLPMSMKDGAVDFVINPASADKVPTDVSAKLDQLKTDIREGKVAVPIDQF